MEDQQVSDWAARLLINNPYPGKSQRDLVQIINACSLVYFQENEVILQEGDKGDELYFLMVGEVAVLKRDTDGENRQLVVMTSPTLFGHMSLVDGSPRSATCKAEGPVTLAVMSRKLYQGMLSRPHPIGTNLRRLMLATLTRQLVNGNSRLHGLMGGEQGTSRKPKTPSNHSKRPTSLSGATEKMKAPKSQAPKSRAPKSRAEKDVSRQDLLEMAGILNGWKVDDTGLADIEIVETEADRRRFGKPSR
jgi:CRP-like cAMP-binding protein